MAHDDRAERSMSSLVAPMMTLDPALDRPGASAAMEAATGSEFGGGADLRHQRSEIDLVRELQPAELIERDLAAC